MTTEFCLSHSELLACHGLIERCRSRPTVTFNVNKDILRDNWPGGDKSLDVVWNSLIEQGIIERSAAPSTGSPHAFSPHAFYFTSAGWDFVAAQMTPRGLEVDQVGHVFGYRTGNVSETLEAPERLWRGTTSIREVEERCRRWFVLDWCGPRGIVPSFPRETTKPIASPAEDPPLDLLFIEPAPALELTLRPMECDVCRFWDSSSQLTTAQPDTTGACRREAPRADSRTGAAVWPMTEDTDWCAMFEVVPDKDGEAA